jgi:hypothetical protein
MGEFNYEEVKKALEELFEWPRATSPPPPYYMLPPYAYKIVKRRLEAGEPLSEEMMGEALRGIG